MKEVDWESFLIIYRQLLPLALSLKLMLLFTGGIGSHLQDVCNPVISEVKCKTH